MKIDRACIEKLRAYQAPPPLVATIMVALMVLLRRSEFNHYIISGGQQQRHHEKKSDGSFSDYTYSRTGSCKSRRNAEPSGGGGGKNQPSHLGECFVFSLLSLLYSFFRDYNFSL